MPADEAAKLNDEWSDDSQSSLDYMRDLEPDPLNDNILCTCKVDDSLREDDDAGSDSSEMRGYYKLTNKPCTVRCCADYDEAGIRRLRREYRKAEPWCIRLSLNENYVKIGAKFIGWDVELTRNNVAMMKASKEFKGAAWLEFCQRHNSDRWIRKYFVWATNIHDRDHIDRVYQNLTQIVGNRYVTVKSSWDGIRSFSDLVKPDGVNIVQAQLFPQIHFVEHDIDVEERKYISLYYAFPAQRGFSIRARNRNDNVLELNPDEYGMMPYATTEGLDALVTGDK
ncbi:hypothetical protein COL940_005005 [Colletotrichum noveboracense]|nr:hypothetical protein COL940_005005 [Colletotrichum noveboracense]